MTYLLGIDAGTSVIKGAIFDMAGREVAVETQRTANASPHAGWSEADMLGTWHAFAKTIRTLLQRSAIPAEQITAVGITGNMIGAWLIDTQGQPVRPAILWNDARTRSLIERLSKENPNFHHDIFALDGCVLETGSTLLQLRWLAENEPHTLARAAYVLNSKDWLRYQLTGDIHIDPSQSAVWPGNIFTQQYDDRLFELFGLTDYRRLFPPIAPSEAIIGTVQPVAAALTGLSIGTPVVTGAGDVPANAIGIGGVEVGVAFTVLGTNLQTALAYDHPVFEPPNVGLLFYVPGQRWFRALMNVAGTTNLDWFINQFCAAEQAATTSTAALYQAVEDLAASSPVGANGVIYHPYLSTAGVIAPFVEPTARAQFFGLTMSHTRADMLRAVYEGVALAVKDCYTALQTPLTEVRFAGGGARSPLWGQIMADCLGVKVIVPHGTEFGAKGAALLAGVGIGQFESIQTASTSTFKAARHYEPQPEHTAIYDAHYALYRLLRDQLLPAWHMA